MRIFKSETKGLIGDDDDEPSSKPQDARDEAARLRAAGRPARSSRRARSAAERSQRGEGTTVNGVPLQQTEHGKRVLTRPEPMNHMSAMKVSLRRAQRHSAEP